MGPELKINTQYSSYPSSSPTSTTSTSRFEDISENQEFNEVMSSNKPNSNVSKLIKNRLIDSCRNRIDGGQTSPKFPPLAGGESFSDSGVILERGNGDSLNGSGIDGYNNSSFANDYSWERGHTSRTSSISTASISPTLSRRNISPLVRYDFQSPSSATSSTSPFINKNREKDRHKSPKIGIVKRVWYRFKLLSRSSNRLVKFLILLAVSFSIWYLIRRTSNDTVTRVKLTTKWWEKDAIRESWKIFFLSRVAYLCSTIIYSCNFIS